MIDLWTEPLARAASPLFWVGVAAKGTVLLVLAAGADRLLRRASSALRHGLWTAALAALLVLPLLSATAPRVDAPAGVQPPADRLARGLERPLVTVPAPESAPETANTAPDTWSPGPATHEPASSRRAGGGPSRGMALVLVWAAGCLLVAGRTAASHLRLHRLARRARPAGPRLTSVVEDALRRHPAGRPVRCLVGEPGAMPMTWGVLRPHLLLPADAADWPAERLHAVLLHELAHIRRHDHAAHALARAACALWWWNPLVWVGAHRSRVEREHACDDAVLGAGADPADYAETLLTVARSRASAWSAPSAATAMAPRSQLEQRLRAVLDPRRSRTRPGMRRAVPTAAALAALALGLSLVQVAPEVAAGGRISIGGGHRGLTVIENDGEWTVMLSRDGYQLEAELEGRVVFREDETDVASLGRGARFRLLEDRDGVERELLLRPGDGAPDRRYEVDGRSAPWDDDAERWLAGALPRFFRASGYDAEGRVERIHARGGTDAVIDEIERMDSGSATRAYLEAMIEVEEPEEAQLRRLLRHVATGFGSDYDRATALGALAASTAFAPSLSVPYAEALNTLDSDYERRRALEAFLERAPLSPGALTLVLRSAADMDSDYELATFLIAVADRHELDDAQVDLLVEAAASLDSDYEMRRALRRAVETGRLSPRALARLLGVAGESIDSDYELAELLVEVAETYDLSGPARDAYRAAADRLDSEYEANRALAAYARNPGGR